MSQGGLVHLAGEGAGEGEAGEGEGRGQRRGREVRRYVYIGSDITYVRTKYTPVVSYVYVLKWGKQVGPFYTVELRHTYT